MRGLILFLILTFIFVSYWGIFALSITGTVLLSFNIFRHQDINIKNVSNYVILALYALIYYYMFRGFKLGEYFFYDVLLCIILAIIATLQYFYLRKFQLSVFIEDIQTLPESCKASIVACKFKILKYIKRKSQ